MPEALKYVIDAAAAAALFLALLVVFVVDWAFFSKAGPGKDTLMNVKVIGGEKRKGDQKKLKLAVTPTSRDKIKDENGKDGKDLLWDDMGKLLKGLGDGYKFDEITEAQIIQKHKDGRLNDYDVIFLTCAEGGDNQKLKDPLASYVAEGGILYASDWRYDAVAAAFPDFIVEKLRGEGASQELKADVVDADLREALDTDKIDLAFELSRWKAAAFGGPRATTLLQAKYRIEKSPKFAIAPLMVKFQFNKGTVIFSSFHNEPKNTAIETKLLQYLVFRLVTEGIDAEVNSSLNKEGFTPQRSNLLSNADAPEIKKTYENAQECTLRFTLGFRGDGAKLRFNIRSPDGKEFTKDSESTIGFEVPNAAKGTWTYTVTADSASANFPFTVTVGAKK